MAALLHQAPLPAAKPHPWAFNSTAAGLSPLHVAVAPMSRRRRAPAVRSAATEGSIIPDAAPPSSKKMTRKEKQLERSREQDMQHRQRQLLMQQASSSIPKANAGGGGNNKEGYDDDDELPQSVFERIIRRIVVAVGLPMASGVGLLNVYDVLKRDQGVEVPSWVPLLTILVSFGTSALGIAYGTLSASWDPAKEGSLLGIDEARANWPVLWAEEIEKEKAKARRRND